MQSQHLAHCVNLLIRRNGLSQCSAQEIARYIHNVSSVGYELGRRGYLRFVVDLDTSTVKAATNLPRESIEDLCALHACIMYGLPIVPFKDLKHKIALVEAVRLRMTR